MRRETPISPSAGFAVSSLTVLLAGALTAGLVVGVVLGLVGGIDLVDEPARIAAAASASYYDCPSGEAIGELTRGDRVFITAQDESGEWVQVRSPESVHRRAWMRSSHVLPDEELGALPVTSCLVPAEVEVILAATTTSSTTTSSSTTSSSTTSTTTTSTTTQPPPTTSSTTTSTLPGPPSVESVAASEDPIWESFDDSDVCNANPNQPTTTLISATVSAPAGVQTVNLYWSVGGEFGTISMSPSGGHYQATLGHFDMVDPDIVPSGESRVISVTVEVTDALQRQATGEIKVTLNDCTFG